MAPHVDPTVSWGKEHFRLQHRQGLFPLRPPHLNVDIHDVVVGHSQAGELVDNGEDPYLVQRSVVPDDACLVAQVGHSKPARRIRRTEDR